MVAAIATPVIASAGTATRAAANALAPVSPGPVSPLATTVDQASSVVAAIATPVIVSAGAATGAVADALPPANGGAVTTTVDQAPLVVAAIATPVIASAGPATRAAANALAPVSPGPVSPLAPTVDQAPSVVAAIATPVIASAGAATGAVTTALPPAGGEAVTPLITSVAGRSGSPAPLVPLSTGAAVLTNGVPVLNSGTPATAAAAPVLQLASNTGRPGVGPLAPLPSVSQVPGAAHQTFELPQSLASAVSPVSGPVVSALNGLTPLVTSAVPAQQTVVGRPVLTIESVAGAPAPALLQGGGVAAATGLLSHVVAPLSPLSQPQLPALAQGGASLLQSALPSILSAASRAIDTNQGTGLPAFVFSSAYQDANPLRTDTEGVASPKAEPTELAIDSAGHLVGAGLIGPGVSPSSSVPSTRTVSRTGTLRPNVMETVASDPHGAGTLPTLASSLGTDRHIDPTQVFGATVDPRGWPAFGSTPLAAWPRLEALPRPDARATQARTPSMARAPGIQLHPTTSWSTADPRPASLLAGQALAGWLLPTLSPRAAPNDPRPTTPLPPLGSLGALGATSSGGGGAGGGFNPGGSGAAAAVLATLMSLLAGWMARAGVASTSAASRHRPAQPHSSSVIAS